MNNETETNIHESDTPQSEGLVDPVTQDSIVKEFPTLARIAYPQAQVRQPQPPPAFATLDFDHMEVLLIYQSLRLNLRNLSQQENEPLDQIDKLTHLLRVIKPAAVKASQLFGQGGQ